ncbi:MAG: hypothetical protein JOZ84_16665 [Methylobacteriaceae bacterium]|nr:hypothetical protein [Methylobacteriaceae bacterium]
MSNHDQVISFIEGEDMREQPAVQKVTRLNAHGTRGLENFRAQVNPAIMQNCVGLKYSPKLSVIVHGYVDLASSTPLGLSHPTY